MNEETAPVTEAAEPKHVTMAQLDRFTRIRERSRVGWSLGQIGAPLGMIDGTVHLELIPVSAVYVHIEPGRPETEAGRYRLMGLVVTGQEGLRAVLMTVPDPDSRTPGRYRTVSVFDVKSVESPI